MEPNLIKKIAEMTGLPEEEVKYIVATNSTPADLEEAKEAYLATARNPAAQIGIKSNWIDMCKKAIEVAKNSDDFKKILPYTPNEPKITNMLFLYWLKYCDEKAATVAYSNSYVEMLEHYSDENERKEEIVKHWSDCICHKISSAANATEARAVFLQLTPNKHLKISAMRKWISLFKTPQDAEEAYKAAVDEEISVIEVFETWLSIANYFEDVKHLLESINKYETDIWRNLNRHRKEVSLIFQIKENAVDKMINHITNINQTQEAVPLVEYRHEKLVEVVRKHLELSRTASQVCALRISDVTTRKWVFEIIDIRKEELCAQELITACSIPQIKSLIDLIHNESPVKVAALTKLRTYCLEHLKNPIYNRSFDSLFEILKYTHHDMVASNATLIELIRLSRSTRDIGRICNHPKYETATRTALIKRWDLLARKEIATANTLDEVKNIYVLCDPSTTDLNCEIFDKWIDLSTTIEQLSEAIRSRDRIVRSFDLNLEFKSIRYRKAKQKWQEVCLRQIAESTSLDQITKILELDPEFKPQCVMKIYASFKK